MNAVFFMLGMSLGSAIMYFLLRNKSIGTLRIYPSDEPGEQPYLFVELGKPVDEICKHKQVNFKVSLK